LFGIADSCNAVDTMDIAPIDVRWVNSVAAAVVVVVVVVVGCEDLAPWFHWVNEDFYALVYYYYYGQ